MELVDLEDIAKHDNPLLYRVRYHAVAVLRNTGDQTVRKRVEFVIESDPFGSRSVTVKVIDEIDAPLIPVTRTIKAHVERLLADGALP